MGGGLNVRGGSYINVVERRRQTAHRNREKVTPRNYCLSKCPTHRALILCFDSTRVGSVTRVLMVQCRNRPFKWCHQCSCQFGNTIIIMVQGRIMALTKSHHLNGLALSKLSELFFYWTNGTKVMVVQRCSIKRYSCMLTCNTVP